MVVDRTIAEAYIEAAAKQIGTTGYVFAYIDGNSVKTISHIPVSALAPLLMQLASNPKVMEIISQLLAKKAAR